jgi:hypothetical protein
MEFLTKAVLPKWLLVNSRRIRGWISSCYKTYHRDNHQGLNKSPYTGMHNSLCDSRMSRRTVPPAIFLSHISWENYTSIPPTYTRSLGMDERVKQYTHIEILRFNIVESYLSRLPFHSAISVSVYLLNKVRRFREFGKKINFTHRSKRQTVLKRVDKFWTSCRQFSLSILKNDWVWIWLLLNEGFGHMTSFLTIGTKN